MPTRKPRDDRQRLFLTTALQPGMYVREIEAEHSDPATWSDTRHVLIVAVAGAACGWLIASGAAWVFGLAGNALQMFTAGSVGLVALIICQSQTASARRVRQWATFERQPETTKLPEFVPVSDSPRTLVLDSPLRRKLTQWAQLLPAANYSLTYRQWTGQGKLFSRQEFDRVRAMMAAQDPPLMKGNEISDAGRAAVGRWSVGNLTADEVHALRGGE